MSGTSGWADGAGDERRWHKLENFVYVTDLVFGDATLDRPSTKIDEVDDAARLWKSHSRLNGLHYVDVKSDAEAFALPQWGPLLERLRAFRLPMQRVRSLVRGESGGVPFQNLCVCDADEDGKVIPYRIWVLPAAVPMPELICDYRSSRGEVPDEVAWCESPGAFVKASAFAADKPVIKEGRFTKSLIGRAIAGKVNDFLDTSVQVTVWAKDSGTAQAVAEAAKGEPNMRRVVWIARGGMFVYATPMLVQGADSRKQRDHLFTHKLVALQQQYAALNRA
ncbi:hypothetical protein O1R50_25650 [Glycomyces luteolus]|uniref:Uncharacterized protein n=1 Tax=Glycomyces luteolus TaxID=2670330 RepID=A0A9X3PDZ8_9ACTN|nr:hypothetical protein [Glycomyces luteolus]MDA1363024.1 hypothetical protein [Glycomyces luteolus]